MRQSPGILGYPAKPDLGPIVRVDVAEKNVYETAKERGYDSFCCVHLAVDVVRTLADLAAKASCGELRDG